MPGGRFYNSKATKNVQTEPAGKKAELKPKQEKEEKERKGVEKKPGVAHEVEKKSISKKYGKQSKAAPQQENTQGAQRKKEKETVVDPNVEVRKDRKANEDQKKNERSEPQIEQESNKGAVEKDLDAYEVARAKGKELLDLLQCGSKTDKVLTQEKGDIKEALKGENETTLKSLNDATENVRQQCDEMNPDQIVIRRKSMYIQSLEKKIFNIHSTLTMGTMKSSRSIPFRKKRKVIVKSPMEWKEERQSLVAQITAREEELWKERSARFILEQEKNTIQYNLNYERQSLFALIAARDEALAKVQQLEYELNQEREERFTVEQEKFQIECRYNSIASHTDYDSTYMEAKVQQLERELNQQLRANKELDAKILIMKDKLEEFEQEKEEWESGGRKGEKIELSRKGESMKEQFKELEEKMKAYEKDIEADVPAIEPKLDTFEALKIFADQKKIHELSKDVAPLVTQILDENGVENVDAFMVLQFVRRSFIEDDDSSPVLSTPLLTPEAISSRIVELREYRQWQIKSPRNTPVETSIRSSRYLQSSLQSNQPINSPLNSTNLGQSSSRRSSQPGSSSALANSSNSATTKESKRKHTTMKWNTSSKVREVNISERTCLICLDPIAERSAIQCEAISCREPLHEDCISAQWKAGIQTCPTCKGPMPDRRDFPQLSRM